MRSSILLRGATVAVVIVAAAAAWTIERAVQRASNAGALVQHTQIVLSQIETVLGLMLDADRAVGDLPTGITDAPPALLIRADRDVPGQIDELATLITDNPRQQEHIAVLREYAAGTLASLQAIVRAKSTDDPSAHELGDAENAELDDMRRQAQEMRLEEDRLLAVRVATDQMAVSSLRWVILALVALSTALLTGILWFLSRARTNLEARVRARSADLREANTRLQSIIDSAEDAIVVTDTGGRIESVNSSTGQLFGYAADELQGQNITALMPGVPPTESGGGQVMGRRKDGTTFPLQASIGEMRIRGERKFTGILHDLTKRVRAEEQIREQASLVRIGEMAAAVLAHEIKNPLAGIRGAVEVIAGRQPEGSRDTLIMREIIARIDGLNSLMKDLLLFARPPRPAFAPVDLLPVVSATVALLKNDPAIKALDLTIEGTAPVVDADPEFLKIVFVNLLTNAAQAMEGHGSICVRLQKVAGRSEVVFQDSGRGVPADLRDKIFTPFFTTKTRGTGLGLATCKRLIESHNGTIALECPVGGGTVVTVSLPIR